MNKTKKKTKSEPRRPSKQHHIPGSSILRSLRPGSAVKSASNVREGEGDAKKVSHLQAGLVAKTSATDKRVPSLTDCGARTSAK